MLTMTRLLAHRLRTVFTRAVDRSSRVATTQLRSDGGALTVSVRGADVAVEYHITGAQPVETFAFPLDLLKRCEGTKDEPVTLESRGNDIEARWTDAGVTQSAALTGGEPFELPPMPERMEPNDSRLITALRDAADSTDDQSTRYALACMQLRPNGGRIAATDSRQLLTQDGFRFPWEEETLIPGNPVFACRDLHDQPVSIGCSADWVSVRAGNWTVHLRIQKDARFPNVDSIIPQAENASSVLVLDPRDGELLLDRLPKLPANAEQEKPVTVDLNGSVSIRSKGESDAEATELRLINSRLEGRPMVVQTNREFLGRAIKLGFQEVRLYESNSTVLCCDGSRKFIWMLLSPEGAVAADANPIQVDPPASHTRTTPSRAARITTTRDKKQKLRSMPTANSATRSESPHKGDGSRANGESSTPARSAVEQLILIRDSLKAAVQQTNDVIRVLKRQRRENRLLESTLSSLRQLQSIAS